MEAEELRRAGRAGACCAREAATADRDEVVERSAIL
jgi:hypothetical protein